MITLTSAVLAVDATRARGWTLIHAVDNGLESLDTGSDPTLHIAAAPAIASARMV